MAASGEEKEGPAPKLDFSMSAADEEAMRQFLPTQFGKVNRVTNVAVQIEQTKRSKANGSHDASNTVGDGNEPKTPLQPEKAHASSHKKSSSSKRKRDARDSEAYKLMQAAEEEEDTDKEFELRRRMQESLLQSFDANESSNETDQDDDAEHEHTARREGFNGEDDEEDDEDEGAPEEDEEDPPSDFPTSHALILKTHQKPITTLTLDSAGGRLVTGSRDCTLKFHDFASMTPTTLHAFKSLDPSTSNRSSAQSDTHPIRTAIFNPHSAAQLLVATSTSQAKLLTRDGAPLQEFTKGDMYLRDLRHTKGHVAEVTGASWSPVDAGKCLTASADGTVRVWDVNRAREQLVVLVYKASAAATAAAAAAGGGGGAGRGRTRICAVAWGNDAAASKSFIVAAGEDGGLALWPGSGPSTRPTAEVRNAHRPGTSTAGIAISGDGRTFVTKGGDETVKLWDARKLRTAVAEHRIAAPDPRHPASDIIYGPDSAHIVCSLPTGHLLFLNPATLRTELVTAVKEGVPVLALAWPQSINQIVAGCADGSTHVFYDPLTSQKGALAVATRAPKRRHVDDDPSLTTDLTSTSLGASTATNPSAARDQAMSAAARHPTLGLTASGRSRDPRRPQVLGRTPWGHNEPDAEHVRRSIPLSTMREEDPREALLKYAETAERDPVFTRAWRGTQPRTIYADVDDSAGEGEEEGKGEGKGPARKKFKS